MGWVLGVVCLFTLNFGIGGLIFGELGTALLLLGVAAVATVALFVFQRRSNSNRLQAR